jgi:hypothetical protein
MMNRIPMFLIFKIVRDMIQRNIMMNRIPMFLIFKIVRDMIQMANQYTAMVINIPFPIL